MTQYGFSEYRMQVRREMKTADNLWVRANLLRKAGYDTEADKLEAQAEHIDNRHSSSNYSTWLNNRA